MYMWCAERARMPSLALLAGLAVNIVLCGLLLPRFGLHGVAWATSAANLLGLSLIYLFNHWLGMRLDRGTLLVTLLLPMALGAVLSSQWLFWSLSGSQLVTGQRLLNADEKSQLVTIFSQCFRKILAG